MVKLVLVNSGKNYEYGVHEPLHLLGLAAYAKKFGHKVVIADQIAGENVFKKIKKLNPDFVGITGTTAVIKDAYEIADWCKRKGFKTILGGVHVTVMPEEGLKHADFVVKGEGEEALIQILSGKAKRGVVVGNYIKNLDDLPKIDRSLVDIKYYQKAKDRNPGSHLHFVPLNTKVNSIIAARGCPFNCIFCHNSWRGLPVRINSAGKIIEEMKELENKYGTEAVFFMDDDFLFSNSRVLEFCKLYKKNKLKTIWGCQARVNSPGLNKETLKEMKEANCRQITFGFESGNQRILSMLKNNMTTVQQNQEAINLVRAAGILVTGSFMIGNPTETEEEIRQTKEFIIKNNLYSGVGITTPYPGTKLWNMCIEKGLIPRHIDWSNFNFHDLTLNLSNISSAKMKKIHEEFMEMSIEKNPGMAFKNILKITLRHPIKAVKRVLANPRTILAVLKRVTRTSKKQWGTTP